ncbi:Imm50 family immunity protein [Streptomyces sp. NPDC051243]|uniref:Imm50 family immunity protein n=1 Tax=Streptomyces sp. NPDC051243 TaxID=3365646 RepID=UPI0037942F60
MPNDWTLALTSARELRDLYGSSPPDLSECALSHVHIDERGCSVTLGLETDVMPSSLPDEWRAKSFDTCEFFIAFGDTDNVRVQGWDASVANAVTISGSPGGCVSVSIGTGGVGMDFRAGSATLTRVRGHLASKAE